MLSIFLEENLHAFTFFSAQHHITRRHFDEDEQKCDGLFQRVLTETEERKKKFKLKLVCITESKRHT